MEKMVFAKSDIKKKSANDQAIIKQEKTWKVIISDDDEQIHVITKLALSHFIFADRKLEFISAYTGLDTIQTISDNPDVAVLLQDVVMETDDAGLEVVKYVRENLKNEFVRIVLRTGQPGQAPERKVIVEYDINDYKEKTELTSQKLFTLMYSSLRSYRDIRSLERNKSGLHQILNSTADIFTRQSVEHFFLSALEQLTFLLSREENKKVKSTRMVLKKQQKQITIISAIGQYETLIGQNISNIVDKKILDLLDQSLVNKKTIYHPDCCIVYLATRKGDERLLCCMGNYDLSDVEKSLVELYVKQLSISFDNLTLYQKVERGQAEIVNLLGTSIETRSKETGNHIKRVAEISNQLAQHIGLNPGDIELLTLASPLHDFGKIGIPDAILNKPGKLDADEWTIMMTHTQIGYDVLLQSDNDVLRAGAIISHEHHEKWDGSGYPQGKKGEDIHIFGRITAVADVFDALASVRCYKKAWPIEEILSFFKKQKGFHFEPRLVDILFDNLEQFTAILERYKDP